MTALRKMNGVTQQALADALTERGLKFHDSSVAKMEKGKRRVSLIESSIIAEVLGVDLDYLIGDAIPADLREYVESQMTSLG
ncbi:helix-turn-helix domain-containing protein [Rhodococcus sp. PvP104]|uniref:helix-turn-helix domain-containing protein n=1 Tax=Rhodococcus sp. PvP104 TaxID=2817911 RepID=UPI001AE7AFA4|nr:helix-turn-helix transcriptional regulator [Rhodococcus sp. PvP104]MBP2522277.1 transcriptional regulator with XRE-family HTH domain [Rhodococcus sp. PvP104]